MNKIAAYGLTKEQLEILVVAIPERYEMEDLKCTTELLVTDCVCAVIEASNLNEVAMRSLLAYYMDVGDRLDETLVWLGKIDLPDLPSFARCDDFLQLLINCKEIVSTAQNRYDTMAQYTDVYSYFPKHAIAECIEADAWVAYQNISKERPEFYSPKKFRKMWTKVLETENGPEFLAAIHELSSWLKKQNIPYHVECIYFGLLDWMLSITEDSVHGSYIEHGDGYTLRVCTGDLPKIQHWLNHHWYFQNSDDRLKIEAIEGLL